MSLKTLNKQTLMIQLSSAQLEEAIYSLLQKETGLNEVMTFTLNALMKLERDFSEERKKEGNKSNGYRFASVLGCGKSLQLIIPRDRLGVFKPVILTLLRQEEERIKDLCWDLYTKGLTTRDIGDITEKLYGEHYSKSTISEISKEFYPIMEDWRKRPLDSHYPVIYIDAIHTKVCRDKVSSEAFYVLLAVNQDTTREVLGIYNAPTESAGMWDEIFTDLKQRGVKDVNLIVTDNLSGVDQSIHKAFPSAYVQKCVIHLMRNLSKKVRPSDRDVFCQDLKQIFNTTSSDDTKEKALLRIKAFIDKWTARYPHVKQLNDSMHVDYHLTYYNFDFRVRSMIYTTNWIERLNKDFRRTLKIRNALPNVESALALMSKVAMDKQTKHYKYGIHQLTHCSKLMDKVLVETP